MASLKDRENFIAVIAFELAPQNDWDERDHRAALEFARFLLRAEVTLHRLAEEACNRELTERELSRRVALEDRVQEACEGYSIGVVFNSDPRGAAIKLRLPSGRSNDFGGEGYFCVP